jgi:hypothetical protein
VPAAVVVDDVATAAELVGRGLNVVLVIDPDAPGRDLPPDGPGRLEVMVGHWADPAVQVAARAMAAELFPDR